MKVKMSEAIHKLVKEQAEIIAKLKAENRELKSKLVKYTGKEIMDTHKEVFAKLAKED